VAFTGGCPAPIGGLLTDAPLDFITVEPNRFVYSDQFDPFIPVDDVVVSGIFGRKVMPIAIEDVKIIINDYPVPDKKHEVVFEKIDKNSESLLTPGVKRVDIYYSGKNAFYRISVGETDKGDGGTDGKGSTGIKWEWPEK